MRDTRFLHQLIHDECSEMIDYYMRERKNISVHVSFVIIMRGMPGCGKSTFADFVRLYSRVRGLRVVVCRADDYFQTDQGYEWRRAGLRAAHEQCFSKFTSTLDDHADVVINDNTNIRIDEFDRYVNAARAVDHFYEIVSFMCHSTIEAEQLATRSEHPIPYPVIQRRFYEYQLANSFAAFAPGPENAAIRHFNNVWVEPRTYEYL